MRCQGSEPASEPSLDITESFKRAAEQILDVSFDFGASGLPAGLGQSGVFVGEYLRDDVSRVMPLIDNLIEHTGIRMLRSKAQAKQFEPQARDFVHEIRDVIEPPATKDVQVAKLPGKDSEFVLVLAGQNRHEEFIFRESCAEILHDQKVAGTDPIAGQLQLRIDLPANSGHECERR